MPPFNVIDVETANITGLANAIRLLALAALTGFLIGAGQVTNADDGTGRLWDEIGRFETEPCSTALVFERILGTWYVTCDGCGAIPTDQIYPEAVIEMVERWAVRGKIELTELLVIYGECP